MLVTHSNLWLLAELSFFWYLQYFVCNNTRTAGAANSGRFPQCPLSSENVGILQYGFGQVEQASPGKLFWTTTTLGWVCLGMAWRWVEYPPPRLLCRKQQRTPFLWDVHSTSWKAIGIVTWWNRLMGWLFTIWETPGALIGRTINTFLLKTNSILPQTTVSFLLKQKHLPPCLYHSAFKTSN